MRNSWFKLTLYATLLCAPAMAAEKIGNLNIYRDANPEFWTGQIDTGPLTHRETGAVFPESYGEAKRSQIMAVDDGKDVMVKYIRARPEGDVHISVFLFQPDDLPEHRLSGALKSLSTDRAGQFIWADGPFDVNVATPLRLFKGTYKQGLGPNTVMDYLYFGELGKWTVKVRATLPSTKAIEDEKVIDTLVRDLPWAAILKANGECIGSGCDTQSALAFNHHIGEMMLGSLTDAMMKKAKTPDGKKVAPLFSRSEGGYAWEVHALPDQFAVLFLDSYGGINVKAPLYSLSRKKKKESEIIRFFSGKPGQALFDATVDGLLRYPEQSAFTESSLAQFYVPGN